MLLLTASGCAANGSETANSAADSASATGDRAPAIAYRMPASGGTLSAYSLPGLERRQWNAGGRVGGARSWLGTDLIGRRLLYIDSAGTASSFDLVALRERGTGLHPALTTIGPDGTMLVLDSAGSIVGSQPSSQSPWEGRVGAGARAAFAGPNQRLLVVRGDSLLFISRLEGVTEAAAVPAGTAVASRDADAVAFITDSGLVVYEDRELEEPWFVRMSGRPRAALFSPSGHRIYVALADKDELAIVDRFGRNERGSIGLPGPAQRLRFDPWGRVLLVLGDDGETWIASMARNDVTGRLRTEWSSDLPAVTEDGVLLVREGANVVARDARSLDSLGAVEGGARDVWFAGRWVAGSATAGLRAQVQDRAGARPATGSRQPATAARSPGTSTQAPAAGSRLPAAAFWTQLMATRDSAAARATAREIGGNTRVVPPPPNDDMYRVMAGPFASREAADSAGRAIGRSYWVVDRSREPARP